MDESRKIRGQYELFVKYKYGRNDRAAMGTVLTMEGLKNRIEQLEAGEILSVKILENGETTDE